MGVYIQGLEMPESCAECRFFVDAWCYAFEADDWRNAYNRPPKGERLDNCPLVPVPPHRRLIDADEFLNDICNSLNEMTAIGVAVDGEWMWGKLNDALDNAPTVIEAEEGK